MDKRISDILNDLYKIDPQFKAHEKELRKLVSELVLAQPDTHFDENFAQRLRAELLETKVRPMPVSSPYSAFFMSRMFYGIVGSALTILVVVPFTFVATQKATDPTKPVVLNPFSQVKDVTTELTPKQQISNKGMNAFGTLALVPTNAGGMGGGSEATAKSSNGGIASMATSDAMVSGGKGAATMMLPYPGAETINYTYKGEKVELKNVQGEVFMRTKGLDSGKQLADIVISSKFGLADIGSFSNLKLKMVELGENKANGYSIGVNFEEGTIYINPQWQYWNSASTKSYEPIPLSAKVPDNTAISLANDFLKAHGIDTASYGAPVVQNPDIRIMAADASSQLYAPDMVTVVYPLMINGKAVYEESGYMYGLVVSIDTREKKVSGVSNLNSQTYDSSNYELETDFNKVLQVATSTMIFTGSDGPKTATLGTPKQVLMHYWLFDEKTGVSNELYIPALSFPITYDTNPYGASNAIVIPLVKDFLNKRVTPIAEPMTIQPSAKSSR